MVKVSLGFQRELSFELVVTPKLGWPGVTTHSLASQCPVLHSTLPLTRCMNVLYFSYLWNMAKKYFINSISMSTVGPLAMHMHYNCANCANFTINVFQLYVNWLKLYLLCSMYAHDKVQLADDMHHVCHDCHLIYYISLSHRHGLQFDTVSVATLFFR